MMMQQPRAAQPTTTTNIGNNDTHGAGEVAATEANRWPLIAEGYGSARPAAAAAAATSAGEEVTLAATSAAASEAAGIERQEDRLQRVDAPGEEEQATTESQRQQSARETTGDSSSSSQASIRGDGTGQHFISSERAAVAGQHGEVDEAKKIDEISKAQVSKQRQLAAVVVERAINLRMQSASEQQSQAQVATTCSSSGGSTSAGCLPTLQQVQRQMQAAQAQLEQRQQERKQQVAAAAAAQAAAQAKPTFKRDEEIRQRADERPDSSTVGAQVAGQRASAAPATTKKAKTLQPSNGGLGSSLPEEISPESDIQSANHLLKSSSSLLADRELVANHSDRKQSQVLLRAENDSNGQQQQQQQQNQAVLQSEQVKSNNLENISMKSDLALQLEISNSAQQAQKPIPTPRFQQQQLFRNELTIETRCPPPAGFGLPQSIMMNQRIKDLSNELSLFSTPSGQSTPTNSSMLSDCSTTISVARLLTEAEMNSSELIPKLIERLDRKLVVMKKEQFALMKEIEYNEACGQQLFDSMRQQLTVAEFDKIQTHANEIEKVTKLILSLKLRLKRIEQELKAEQKSAAVTVSDQNQSHEVQQQQQQHDSLLLNDSTSSSASSSSSSSSSSSGEHPSLLSTTSSSEHHQVVKHNNHNTNTSHSLPSQAQQQQPYKTTSSTTTCDDASSCCHLATMSTVAGKQQPTQRGVSDPTSTVGLPKRNHHHHASLQAPAKLDSTCAAGQSGSNSKDRQVSAASSATSNDGSETHRRHGKPPSTSSDSIFNSADSAIGSCTIINSSASSGHGGSSSNLAHDGPTTADRGGTTSSTSTAHNHHHLHDSDQLSSGLSAGSRSSLSSTSTPSSPSLMSPTVSTSSTSSDANNNNNNNRGVSSDKTARAQTEPTTCESLLNLISNLDILMAKRNKLVAQLEEAHQLEECIARRNNNLVERILKKYYQEDKSASGAETACGGEIALFRQFTKLKSLLLKDSHDINDRIENAELQLSELKQTSQCQ